MTNVAITSPSNPRVTAAARLRDRRERDRRGLTLVDGAREVQRALIARVDVEEAFVCPALIRTRDAEEAATTLEGLGRPIWTLSEAAFQKVAFGDRSDGVVAVVRPPPAELAALNLPADPLVVVLERVEKPGNLGAILRSADGAGADAVIVADPGTDLYNPNAIRASLGTIFSVPLAVAASGDVRTFLRDHRVPVVAARLEAAKPPWRLDLRGPVAFVLGAEATGLEDDWTRDGAAVGVRIPMHGIADSLNVSVAAAILLYEARRQRG
jgi:TrmH family RNA methyltransferase